MPALTATAISIGTCRCHTLVDCRLRSSIEPGRATHDRCCARQTQQRAATADRNLRQRSSPVTLRPATRFAICSSRSDLIHADGMSLVFASHLFCNRALPERICTTDFFHDVAIAGQNQRGAHVPAGRDTSGHTRSGAIRSIVISRSRHCRPREWIYAPQRRRIRRH